METRGATYIALDFRAIRGELIAMSSSGDTTLKVVFRLSHMGDVALTTGVLSHWHETLGDSYIFITRKGNAQLLENHPAVAKIITVDSATLRTGTWLKRARALAKEYANHTLIDLHGTLRSRILSLFWRGPVHRYPKFDLTRRLYDRTHAVRYRKVLEATNVPQRYAMALGSKPPLPGALVPRIYLSEFEQDDATLRLQHLTDSKPLVALHPYATYPAKQWPREHWRALTGLLASAGMDWIIVGRDTSPLFDKHERDLTNQTDLREICAILSRADMLITADSGPMHLACGVDTPVLALFGPTAKSWGFYPAGPRDRVLERNLDCRPCSLHGGKACPEEFECLTGISPDEVMTTAQEILNT